RAHAAERGEGARRLHAAVARAAVRAPAAAAGEALSVRQPAVGGGGALGAGDRRRGNARAALGEAGGRRRSGVHGVDAGRQPAPRGVRRRPRRQSRRGRAARAYFFFERLTLFSITGWML